MNEKDRYSMDFGLDSDLVFDSDELVEEAKQLKEEAKKEYHETKAKLRKQLVEEKRKHGKK